MAAITCVVPGKTGRRATQIAGTPSQEKQEITIFYCCFGMDFYKATDKIADGDLLGNCEVNFLGEEDSIKMYMRQQNRKYKFISYIIVSIIYRCIIRHSKSS